MTPMRSRRLKLALASVGLLMLITFAAYREIEHGITGIHIAFADDQTAIFEEMLEKVERGDIGEAADHLAYVVNYYPSGTKQVIGSRLDRVVERARRSALREIIASLRIKTHQDFGDDPERWIEGLKRLKAQ
jgi:hypothetical protein